MGAEPRLAQAASNHEQRQFAEHPQQHSSRLSDNLKSRLSQKDRADRLFARHRTAVFTGCVFPRVVSSWFEELAHLGNPPAAWRVVRRAESG